MSDIKETVSIDEWSSYQYHMKKAITTVEELSKWIRVYPEEREAILQLKDKYKFRVTPYYASLMDKQNKDCPIRLQAIPSLKEISSREVADIDPVEDCSYLKTPRIIHKYPNRVAFLISDICPVYCRHCTRKYHTINIAGTYYGQGFDYFMKEDFEYIKSHSEIDDVLLTGGDPLSLSDQKLELIIANLRSIPHVNIIRIGSRFPVVLPQRITPELCDILAKFGPCWLNTHFNHPKEVTEEALEAVERLLKAGIPVQNQSVLLKGVNDDARIMRTLLKKLVGIKVRPYYLYHCDNVAGVEHFRTTINKGMEIMENLIGFETGFSVPQYVIATKIGKIPISPSFCERLEDETVMVRNYAGERLDITDYIKVSEGSIC